MAGDNYLIWSRVITMAFEARNELGYINGKIKERVTILLTYDYLNCYNSMGFSWWLNFVSKEIANSVIFMKKASDVWTDLHDRFSQQNANQDFDIQQVICNHLQMNDSMVTYYIVLKGLWDELEIYNTRQACSCVQSKISTIFRNMIILFNF